MPHSHVCTLHHVVFSTKDRRPLLAQELLDPVAAYLGGIARQNGMTALAVGTVPDHAHILLSTPGSMAIAKAVQLMKAGSSKWFRETHSARFGWQEGYAAFSVSKSNEARVRAYVLAQREHHQRQDFVAEFRELLRRHGLELQAGDLD
jgi:putative transposase